MNRKQRKLVSGIIVVILVLCMVIPFLANLL
jgi:hypothetical protein